MPALTLRHADAMIDAALEEGRRQSLAPLAVAVLDAGGNLIACKREDGAGIVRIDIAVGKAWGSLGMGFGTREIVKRAAAQPVFFTSLAAASGGRMLPSPGGVLVLGTDGGIIGAVGISGDIGDRDEDCAVAGVVAAGFQSATGEPPRPDRPPDRP